MARKDMISSADVKLMHMQSLTGDSYKLKLNSNFNSWGPQNRSYKRIVTIATLDIKSL